ncbi:MAG TPA: hypothetical protein VMP68_08950 [Candidatus Eisenbacteria bacterium]|nr:hypothetical protein [Candidatus Eisenbacteria bacterium]
MSYKPESKLYELAYETMPGLVITAKGMTIGEMNRMQDMDAQLRSTDETLRLQIFEFFASKIITWNVVHPDVLGDTCAVCGLPSDAELPPTVAGLLCLDLSTVIGMLTGWVYSIARVSVPKEMSLSSGDMPIHEQMMQTLSKLEMQPVPPTSSMLSSF